MNTQSLDLQLEMLLDRSRLEISPGFLESIGLSAVNTGYRRDKNLARWAMVWMLIGFGIIVSVVFVLTTSGALANRPETWMHGLFALVAAEVLIVVGAMIRMSSSVNESQELLKQFLRSQSSRRPRELRATLNSTPFPAQFKALQSVPADRSAGGPLKGQIGDRKFMVQADGSVEIETLLGPRRFTSIESAREFVGGDVVCEPETPAARPLLAA